MNRSVAECPRCLGSGMDYDAGGIWGHNCWSCAGSGQRIECEVCGSATGMSPDPAGYAWHATDRWERPWIHADNTWTPEQRLVHEQLRASEAQPAPHSSLANSLSEVPRDGAQQ